MSVRMYVYHAVRMPVLDYTYACMYWITRTHACIGLHVRMYVLDYTYVCMDVYDQ